MNKVTLLVLLLLVFVGGAFAQHFLSTESLAPTQLQAASIKTEDLAASNENFIFASQQNLGGGGSCN